MIATKTAVIVLCQEAVLIWAIPPLLPQPPSFLVDNPILMPPPLFTIPFPDGISLNYKLVRWNSISSWYSCSSGPLYFGVLCEESNGSKFHRFQIVLEPDLSAASLHVINTSEITTLNFNVTFFLDYRICEDTLVSCWTYDPIARPKKYQCGVITGLTSARFSKFISYSSPAGNIKFPADLDEYRFFLCPASGRSILLGRDNNVAVLDYL